MFQREAPNASTTTSRSSSSGNGPSRSGIRLGGGNQAISRTLQRQSLEDRERDRELGNGTRDVPGQGNSGGQHLDSDWAGRAILARWIAGDGDWDIDEARWADYMRAHAALREKMARHARYVISNTAALGPDAGVQNVIEEYPVAIENGEGIVGYQYLHGTNATVGGYQITGWAHLEPVPSPEPTMSGGDQPGPQSSANMQVHWYFEYRWNDMIDPNARYVTDRWKSALGEIVSLGSSADYRISITWRGEGIARVDSNANITSVVASPAPAPGATLYPLP